MKTIIALTDFSETAQNASRYAIQFAMHLNATLLLVHIAELPWLTEERTIGPLNDITRKASKEIIRCKDEISRLTNGRHNIHWEIVCGSVFTELERICKREQPYAVIIGVSGKTGMEKVLGGSHTTYLLRHLPWPVIAIPPHFAFSEIRNIVLACDLEDTHAAVPFGKIRSLLHDFQAKLHVLNIGKASSFMPEQVSEAEYLLTQLGDVDPAYVFLTSDHTDESICEYLLQNQPDLLILLPRHHGIFSTLLHRSYTGRVTTYSVVPVMSMRSYDAGKDFPKGLYT